MAIYQTRTELKNFKLTNGTTVNLIALINTGVPEGWVAPTKAPEIGTVAYVSAMGAMRRGVVVKTTKTKVHVAVTTQGALDTAMRFGWTQPVRVQIAVADINHVRVAPPTEPVVEAAKTIGIADPQDLTPNSQDGKVTGMNEIKDQAAENEPCANENPHAARETTGSSVVKLLERVHERIRQNHPDIPAVVIVTGAGTSPGAGSKWGHFRAKGWMIKSDPEGAAIHAGEPGHLDEMFMAGETLAKGARQVLQTMLHESAHALAVVRGQQDTSRQGRWHNKTFLSLAEEMGLKHSRDKADKTHGYSFMTLTENTVEVYADLLKELDREIHLMVKLPFWLGGDAGEQGGEGMGKKPTGGSGSSSNNVKLTCDCPTPNIIRASKKVADKCVVRCDACESRFMERGE